jgi:hypothetical protein
MSLYFHHVPGRLRLKTPRLQGRRRACDETRAIAAAIEGVIEASANPITGSLIIYYDRKRLTPERLWRALSEHRIVWGVSPIADGVPVARAKLQPPADPSPAGQLFETVTGMIIDKLAQRSAAILLSALI